jgi:hypothetical protein
VIYFFLKDRQFVQCEIHPGPPHILTVIDAEGSAHSESYAVTETLQEHWGDICRRLELEGWQGPFGRDSRA